MPETLSPTQVIHPFYMATQELLDFVEVGLTGLGQTLSMREMHAALERWTALLKQHDPKWTDPPPLDSHTDRLEAFAKEQKSLGFPYLYHSACVRLWSLPEALVDEIALQHLRTDSASLSSDLLRSLKGALLPFVEMSEEERRDQLLDLLAQQLQLRRHSGIGAAEAILGVLNLGGQVSEDVRRVLFELAEVRNAIVHRNGRCDGRLAAACPWLSMKSGDLILVTHNRFGGYISGVQWYFCELTRRWDGKLPADSRLSEGNIETLEGIQRRCREVIAAVAKGREGAV